MLQPRTISKSIAAIAAVMLVHSTQAFCGISQVSAGAAAPSPFGSAGDTLNRPVGFTAQAWLETPNFLPGAVEWNLAFEFLPFQMLNAGGANSIQANINMVGVYTGLTFWGGPSVFGFRPYISGDLGGLYDYLVFPGASTGINNAGTAFALRVAPGFDLPLFNHFGLQIEMPYTAAFQKTTLTMWESTFSLRWKL
jgi:hypothetical protein